MINVNGCNLVNIVIEMISIEFSPRESRRTHLLVHHLYHARMKIPLWIPCEFHRVFFAHMDPTSTETWCISGRDQRSEGKEGNISMEFARLCNNRYAYRDWTQFYRHWHTFLHIAHNCTSFDPFRRQFCVFFLFFLSY